MRVNDHFATELGKIIEPDDLIWVHDYHLIPIADALRCRGHANRIGFFLHVPPGRRLNRNHLGGSDLAPKMPSRDPAIVISAKRHGRISSRVRPPLKQG
jgi:hypothetical protein